MLLAVGEAIGNVAVHAYGAGGGRLRLEATLDGDRLVVVVADDGTWRPPLDSEGRGLHIIEQMSDTLDVDTDDYGTTVRFTRLLARVDGAGGATARPKATRAGCARTDEKPAPAPRRRSRMGLH